MSLLNQFNLIYLFKAEKLPLAEVEEVIQSTGTVEDDEGMIKYDGNLINQFLFDYNNWRNFLI